MFRERVSRIKRRRQKLVKAGGETGGDVGRQRCKSWSVGGVGKARAQSVKRQKQSSGRGPNGDGGTELGLSRGRRAARAARTRAEETRRYTVNRRQRIQSDKGSSV